MDRNKGNTPKILSIFWVQDIIYLLKEYKYILRLLMSIVNLNIGRIIHSSMIYYILYVLLKMYTIKTWDQTLFEIWIEHIVHGWKPYTYTHPHMRW